jgi:hypothetical protein
MQYKVQLFQYKATMLLVAYLWWPVLQEVGQYKYANRFIETTLVQWARDTSAFTQYPEVICYLVSTHLTGPPQ